MDIGIGLFEQVATIMDGSYNGAGMYESTHSIVSRMIGLLIPFIYHIIVNILIKKKSNFSLYPWQLVVIIIFGIGILIIVPPINAMARGNTISNKFYIVMGAAFIIMHIIFVAIIFWQGYVMRKNETLKRKENSYKYMLETQEKYFEELLKNYNEIRKIRHDIRGHIVALREYANENADDKILQYLSDMEEKTNSLVAYKYVGNNAVDSVINDQVQQMKNIGIKFEFDGFCNVREDIKEFDLCTIFYNLIRNSMEACEKIDAKDKVIYVKVKNIGDKLGIYIKNETILKEIPSTGILVTTKKDKINHGLGTVSVRDVVSRYDGVYVNRIENGHFIANVVI
ncbi:MAG: GHKL domain-containing protein [Eubacterium sp.]|nr:GHKL domain-containing protein [Eubacterium sp.]